MRWLKRILGGIALVLVVAIIALAATVSFEAAAAAPIAGVTALQALRDAGGVQRGDRVLVNGASGGVGPFAIQLAKYFGADVTGVASARKEDLAFLAGRKAAGELEPQVDRRYPLEEVADAIRYSEDGHARAKIIIEIGAAP